MNWLERKDFIMHSGDHSSFKIECDNLTDEEIETFAYLISEKLDFQAVMGIPNGGIRLADALEKYKNRGAPNFLVVDDVLTTGRSMEDTRIFIENISFFEVKGAVMFSRGICPAWITPVFQLCV